MAEIVELRQENAKTFDLGGQKRGLLASIGAIHYKDDYTNAVEQWKDIDLTWVGNQILKAPYELTLEGKKLTIKDKKTGVISTIELTEIGGKPIKSIPDIAWEKSKGLARAPGIVSLDNVALDTDLEVVAENGRVKFARVLKSNKAPLDAKFRITGNFVVKAQDADGELPVETSLVGDTLTETLKPDRVVKYPVRIDPTWQVGASADDCLRSASGTDFSLTYLHFMAGYDYTIYVNDWLGAAARFLNLNISAGATITLANLVLTAIRSDSATTVNTRLRAELNVNPATFSDVTDFDARTWTTAHTHWNAIAAWTAETEYTSDDFHTSVQEVADLGAITHLAVCWDDFEKLSTATAGRFRDAYPYDSSTTKAPKLYVEYTEGGGGVAGHRFFQMF